jgi:RimJ/RimL family protein N-acetyltransferase
MTTPILLRDVAETDLPIFYQHQLDPVAISMAAFTPKDPADRDAFDARWAKILADPNITAKTILFQGQIAGHVLCHAWFGQPEISYWIGREFWGQGIATTALAHFLGIVKTRPLYARAAKDNIGSIRVLQKNGFTIAGTASGFSNARGEEVEELLLQLEEQGT